MVRAGCVFVAGIHPSRTWTSGSFESVRWNACVHRLTSVYTLIRKSFWGNGVCIHVNSKGKIPSTGKFPQRRIEPATLWTASPNTTNELFRPLPSDIKKQTMFIVHQQQKITETVQSVYKSKIKLNSPVCLHVQNKIHSPSSSQGWSVRKRFAACQKVCNHISILLLGEMESWICNFNLSVIACAIVWADLSLRYPVAETLSNQPTNNNNALGALQIQLSISPSHSIQTPGQPVPALTL